MPFPHRPILAAMLVFVAAGAAIADVGDPQVKTDHPWYPGELACSTFDRLFATQEAVYRRVTGKLVTTDEDRALASWLWRNTHYWHAEEGAEDLWGDGFGKGPDTRTREYWTGLFAHGFGLCGTTHSQWVAEMEARFGHGSGRSVGTAGHNSFEVFLRGGAYGSGRWALLDHDISTVIFAPNGDRLLGIGEVQPNWKTLTDRESASARQGDWLVCGLHPNDGGVYAKYGVAEYLSGYAGPPPMVRLRRGETLRRYLEPGLADGKTFVYWGRNYRTGGIPGPERSRTWVNQPETMHGSKAGTPHRDGQARYANAVFTYRPDFRTADYKEGVLSEDDTQVTFGFSSPYIIAATPPNDEPWGIYDAGGTNGLVLTGTAECAVSVSVDRGTTWHECGQLAGRLDLTDRVKGFRQYRLKFHAPAARLADAGLTMTTVCQCNSSVIPRLTDNGSTVTFAASGAAIESAGPTLPQAKSAVVAGAFDTPRVTLEVASPRGEPVRAVVASAHVRSSSPPNPDVRYQIEYSTDDGQSWRPVVKDWTINRRGDEPKDFWSQSMCWGSTEVPDKDVSKVQVRFRNDGGKIYARGEVQLVYDAGPPDATKVTFVWDDDRGPQTASHTFPGGETATWTVPTGQNVRTKWVEYGVAE